MRKFNYYIIGVPYIALKYAERLCSQTFAQQYCMFSHLFLMKCVRKFISLQCLKEIIK